MNTLEIFSFLKNDNACSKYFIGVFPRDEAPIIFHKLPCSFILNTDKRNESGSHWLAFFIDYSRKVEFFDPYGYHPNYYNLSSYLNKISSDWISNDFMIQSPFSSYCGQICLFYLYFKSRAYSLNYIINNFSDDLIKNEKIIINFLKFIKNN